jgi:enoyl-CoA hydratase
MTEQTAAPLVVTDREGALGVLRLNRPKALNALTLEMVRLLREGFDAFLADPAVAVILLEAAEGRAFCAGGDIRAVFTSGKAGDGEAETFWREEYELISALAHSPKPVVCLMDGIVMGGGAGLAMHLKHRVITEKVRFAMPEVGIGFVPDVGASFLLPRLKGALGRYLAFTGESIGAGDMLFAGLADHFLPAGSLPSLRRALAALSGPVGDGDVGAFIAGFARPAAPDLFAAEGETIAAAFAAPDAAAILARLQVVEGRGAGFAEACIAVIGTRSPLSLALTAELLRLGAAPATLEECLVREFRAAVYCLQTGDFYEGVRAAVIDKDRQPQWPSRLAGAGTPPLATVFAGQTDRREPMFDLVPAA